jgi:DHA1 family tetracycline resistance protein-like MFS transporter
VGFIGQFGLGMVQATFALRTAILFRGASVDATNLGVGLLLAAVGFSQFVTQTWLIHPLKARFGDARLVILGTLLRAAALVIWAVVASPWLAAVGSIVFALGTGLSMPPLQTWRRRTVDESMRGGAGVQSSVSLAIIISTAVAGRFSRLAHLPYWTGAALCLAAVLPAVSLKRWANGRPGALPEPCPERPARQIEISDSPVNEQ